MRERTRRLGRFLLAVVELGLAGFVLISAAILGDIQAGVQRGEYNPEAAGGVGFMFLLVWFLGGLALAAVLFLHAVGWTFWTDRGRAVRRDAGIRVGAELLVAVAVVAIATAGSVPVNAYEYLRTVSVVLSVLVVVHVLVNALRFARTAVAAG